MIMEWRVKSFIASHLAHVASTETCRQVGTDSGARWGLDLSAELEGCVACQFIREKLKKKLYSIIYVFSITNNNKTANFSHRTAHPLSGEREEKKSIKNFRNRQQEKKNARKISSWMEGLFRSLLFFLSQYNKTKSLFSHFSTRRRKKISVKTSWAERWDRQVNWTETLFLFLIILV